MRTVLMSVLTVLTLATLSAVPGTLAHQVTCFGNPTSAAVCLIVCDQTHRVFQPGPHDCSWVRTPPPCDLVELDDSIVIRDGTIDLRRICSALA